MSKKDTAKTAATATAVAVAGFAAFVLAVGTYKWVKYDILNYYEK